MSELSRNFVTTCPKLKIRRVFSLALLTVSLASLLASSSKEVLSRHDAVLERHIYTAEMVLMPT